jgi:hypothetical protein
MCIIVSEDIHALCLYQRFPKYGARPRGAVGPLVGGESCLYDGRIYFERIWAKRNMYFGRNFAWLNVLIIS